MKSTFIKSLLAMTLALIALISSIPSPVQAAEPSDSGTHDLVVDNTREEWIEYEAANSGYHYIYKYIPFRCISHEDCDFKYTYIRQQIGYEMHDLSGFAPSPNRYKCVICGYEE